jgi:hypothetical protein
MNVRTLRALAAGALFVGAAAVPASAQWQNRLVDPPTMFGDNNEINDINEAESILASPPAGSTTTTNTSDVIDFPNGAPAGFAGEDFATSRSASSTSSAARPARSTSRSTATTASAFTATAS